MLLRFTDGPSPAQVAGFAAGYRFVKHAGDAAVAYNLRGTLQLAGSGYLLLSVPNTFVRGVFAAMHEPGIELPPSPEGLRAHITVMRPEELARIGGAGRVSERGKQFSYSLGRLVSVEPDGWKDVARAWLVQVHSPELQALRRSYGLSSLPNDGKHAFHVTVAVKRKGVLGRNETAKAEPA